MSKTFVLGAVSILAALAIGAVVSGLAVKAHFEAILDTFVPQVDTTYIHDTLRVTEPVFVASKPIHDSIPVPVPYPVAVHDTLYLPKEQKYYADSTYKAWVSGVSPKLDSIYVFPTTKIITKTVSIPEYRKQRLNFGVQAGVGAVQPFAEPFSPKLGYYVGLGIQWNF
jgi:LysM repeat protein